MSRGNTPTPTSTMNLQTWGLLVLLSLLWGGSFFFGQVAVREMPPVSVAMGRVGIAAIALVAFVYARGDRLPGGAGIWLMFAVMGLINNVIPFNLILFGQTQISSGLASILNATTPIFTVVLAHFLTADEKLSLGRLLGVGCGLLGVALMLGTDALAGAGENVLGQTVVLGAAASYAMAGIFGRRLRQFQPTVAASGQLVSSSLLMVPIVLIVDRPWQMTMPSLSALAAVAALAVLCTSAAYVIYFRILAVAGATNVLLVTLLVPVSAILLGTLILGEALLPTHLLGMTVIGLGLLAIDGRPAKYLRRKLSSPAPQKNPAE